MGAIPFFHLGGGESGRIALSYRLLAIAEAEMAVAGDASKPAGHLLRELLRVRDIRPFSAGVEKRRRDARARSEEHTSELQSLMRISYAVFCLKKKTIPTHKINT